MRWELSEIKNEIDEIKKLEEKSKRKDLKHETKKYIFDFQHTCKAKITEVKRIKAIY